MVYSASYDPWGNQSSRTYNGVTATLSYDQFNRLAQWDAGSNGQEQYVYDVSGNRVLKRSTSGGTTSLTAYAFGLQELSYTGNGVASGQINYYSLAGHLIGSTDGSNTTFYLTDAQGSVLTSISQSAVLGEQVYGPYGNQRYVQGTLGTDKGYTGQFHDNVTGLDYYNARYYDPVVGMFVSPDSVQGNAQGMDPTPMWQATRRVGPIPLGRSMSVLMGVVVVMVVVVVVVIMEGVAEGRRQVQIHAERLIPVLLDLRVITSVLTAVVNVMVIPTISVSLGRAMRRLHETNS